MTWLLNAWPTIRAGAIFLEAPCFLQVKQVASLVDRDFTASVHITDFPNFLKKLKQQPVFTSEELILGLADVAASKPEYQELFDRLHAISTSVQSFHLMVRSTVDNPKPTFVVFIRTKEVEPTGFAKLMTLAEGFSFTSR